MLCSHNAAFAWLTLHAGGQETRFDVIFPHSAKDIHQADDKPQYRNLLGYLRWESAR